MTGKFKIDLTVYKKKKHDHLVLEFNNNLKLIYNDVRKFGYIKLAEKPFDIFNLKNLGYEPAIVENFRDILFAQIKKRKASIKDILLDQSFICGIGNIYASEILHKAKISPFKKGITFYKDEFLALLKAIQNIIEEDGSKILFIKLNEEISPYVASKGSITIEGVSLTVNDVKNDHFNVNIIPFTWDNTNLRDIKVNDFVNVEIDLLSRYLVNYQKQKDN